MARSLDDELSELSRREVRLFGSDEEEEREVASMLASPTGLPASLEAELEELEKREERLLERHEQDQADEFKNWRDELDAQLEELEGPGEGAGGSEFPSVNEIIPGLFVGSAEAALEVITGNNDNGIAHVLNVSGQIPAFALQSMCASLAELEQNGDVAECAEVEQEGRACARRTMSWTQNGITTLVVPMDDYGRTELTEQLLSKCCDFVRRGLADGGHVLVHCAVGVNRSVTIAAAFLMRERGLSASEALQLLAEKRPAANPTKLYVDQLRGLEKPLLS